MGRFFDCRIWLEDREIEVLESYDFTEEVPKHTIPKDKHWILDDLCCKGFLVFYRTDEDEYYQNAGGYLQHFT